MNDLDFDSKNIDKRPIRIATDDALYPERVKTIMGRKAPKHLDVIGNTDLLDMAGIGFCGSRKSSTKGLETARDCANQVALNNVSVISGNAAGVDFESHYSCLEAGGKTILVLPEGINHFRIRKALRPVWDWERVLVISQFEPGEPWKGFRAMTRNQLIIALSRALIVIEAGEKGGTIDAGTQAMKFGLPLYVVKYQNMPVEAGGNEVLLNMGAEKLTKSRSRNKANLANIFSVMKEDKFLKNLPQQRDLLLAGG